jgi:hypothetical protein
MVLPGIVDEWNYWTDACDPQEFMNLSRAQGHPTIGAAVDAYVVEIPGLDRAWAALNAEELEEIRDMLMSYLFLARSVEWRYLLDAGMTWDTSPYTSLQQPEELLRDEIEFRGLLCNLPCLPQPETTAC